MEQRKQSDFITMGEEGNTAMALGCTLTNKRNWAQD